MKFLLDLLYIGENRSFLCYLKLNLVLLIQLIELYKGAAAEFNAEVCSNINKMHTICLCRMNKSKVMYTRKTELEQVFVIQCFSSDLNSSARVIMIPSTKVIVVYIKCKYNELREYDLVLPNVTSGYNAQIEIRTCDTMFKQQQQPIADKFVNLGINQTHSLSIGYGNLADSLTRQLFKSLQHLKLLTMYMNNITLMSAELFSDLQELIHLNLSTNSIEELDMRVFFGLNQLMELDLSTNRLRHIPSGIFQNLSFLLHLNLFKNDLSVLSADIFQGATSMERLILRSNKISDLPADLLWQQPNLTYLDFSQNQLKTLPSKFFQNMNKLNVLLLSYNQLSEITSEHFASIEVLSELKIDNNRLVTIDADAFYHCTVLELNLENNQIHIPQDKVIKLKYFTSHQINSLNLRNNSITHFTRAAYHLGSFVFAVDFSQNKINSLNVRDLMISNDRNAVYMNFTYNRISEIDFQAVESLVPDDRKMTVVNVDVNNNPLNCSCKLVPFVKYLRAEIAQNLRRKLFLSTDALRCEEPNFMRGVLVNEVDVAELLCHLYTDDCPNSCECWERTVKSTLIVNCTNFQNSNVLVLPDPRKLKLNSTELDLSNNNIAQLPHNTMPGYSYVTHIYARNNMIAGIDVIHLPPEISHLDLRHNHLERLNGSVLELLQKSSRLKLLYLSHNPWLCVCETKQLLAFVQSNYDKIPDFREMFCYDPGSVRPAIILYKLSITDVCPSSQWRFEKFIIATTIIGIAIVISVVLFYKYQREIQIWCYSRNLCLCCIREKDLDKDKIYDAFVSYSHKDEQFIAEHLVPQLEQDGPLTFKLCIHERDWIIGECIPDQIMRSIGQSRRTIILLSQNFIESVWSRVEFRAAHYSAMNEKRSRLIVILYNKLNDIENIDPIMKSYLKMHTYLKWGDPYFWDKLRYAMPHTRRRRRGVRLGSINLAETTSL